MICILLIHTQAISFKRNYSYRRKEMMSKNERKGKARPKITLVGAIILAIGILVVMSGGNVMNFNIMMGGMFTVTVGTVMLLLSLSRRNQVKFVKGMNRVKETFKDDCQCCKCQNCGRNHNHWTHD